MIEFQKAGEEKMVKAGLGELKWKFKEFSGYKR